MLIHVQRCFVVLSAAVLFGCAGLAPVSSRDADRELSDAIEQALPSLVLAGDYWTASKASFQLAGARSRLKETRAACAALSRSLDYYRKAVATDTDFRPSFTVFVTGADSPPFSSTLPSLPFYLFAFHPRRSLCGFYWRLSHRQ